MQFTFTPMNEVDAQAICSWHYEEAYSVYNIGSDAEEDAAAEMLDRRSPYYAVRNEQGKLVGFFCYGTSAQPWHNDEPGIYAENRTVPIGLGLRPDLTGKGLGVAFVNAGLDFARKQFAPKFFCLYVMTFNERAIKVYENVGFERVGMYMQHNAYGEHAFLEMRRGVE